MNTEEETQILKVDEAGRVIVPRQRREAILDDYERSGMTGAQYARHVGVKYPTFMNWVQARRRERCRMMENGRVAAGSSPWIEAVVEGGDSGGLEVELCGEVRIRIGDRGRVGLAVEVLRGLGYGRPC